MNRQAITLQQWAATHPFEAFEIDCVTAVMLKILDEKCKMSASGKVVMAQLYDCVKSQDGQLLGTAEHQLITEARASELDEAMRMRIYERRLLAETMISRPVMKRFKAMLKAEGIISSA